MICMPFRDRELPEEYADAERITTEYATMRSRVTIFCGNSDTSLAAKFRTRALELAAGRYIFIRRIAMSCYLSLGLHKASTVGPFVLVSVSIMRKQPKDILIDLSRGNKRRNFYACFADQEFEILLLFRSCDL